MDYPAKDAIEIRVLAMTIALTSVAILSIIGITRKRCANMAQTLKRPQNVPHASRETKMN